MGRTWSFSSYIRDRELFFFQKSHIDPIFLIIIPKESYIDVNKLLRPNLRWWHEIEVNHMRFAMM